MKLAELKTELEGKPETLHVIYEDHDYHVYAMVTYLTNQEMQLGKQETFNIVIAHRNEANEAAYFERKPPYMITESSWLQELKTAIENYQASHPELELYEITMRDDKEKKAIVLAYEYDSQADAVNKNEYLVFKADAQIRMRKIAAQI